METNDIPDLERRMQFLTEVEKLKTVYRQNMTVGSERHENSAEHSWHVALMALVLGGHARDYNLDLLTVITMLLIHDIVEIDAGDTFLYDDEANVDRNEREERAAARLFGLLPAEQRDSFIALWREFEQRSTPEARFAAALDGMQPVLNHYCTDGTGVRKYRIPAARVIEKKRYIADASPELWRYTEDIIRRSTEKGLYTDE